VILFLKLNQSQITLIRYLTEANQSLLNQARTKDISTLAGLDMMTGQQQSEEQYLSTDDREMAAYYASLANNTQLGEVQYDEEDMANLRSGL
jgi:hypothetical protein